MLLAPRAPLREKINKNKLSGYLFITHLHDCDHLNSIRRSTRLSISKCSLLSQTLVKVLVVTATINLFLYLKTFTCWLSATNGQPSSFVQA